MSIIEWYVYWCKLENREPAQVRWAVACLQNKSPKYTEDEKTMMLARLWCFMFHNCFTHEQRQLAHISPHSLNNACGMSHYFCSLSWMGCWGEHAGGRGGFSEGFSSSHHSQYRLLAIKWSETATTIRVCEEVPTQTQPKWKHLSIVSLLREMQRPLVANTSFLCVAKCSQFHQCYTVYASLYKHPWTSNLSCWSQRLTFAHSDSDLKISRTRLSIVSSCLDAF